MSPKSSILITSFFALLAFATIENQILAFVGENTPNTPEVAGASIGAIVEPTPLNTGWEELRKEQEKLKTEKEKIEASKSSFTNFFEPTERSIRYLYIFLFVFFCLVVINLLLDLYILKSQKRKTHA